MFFNLIRKSFTNILAKELRMYFEIAKKIVSMENKMQVNNSCRTCGLILTNPSKENQNERVTLFPEFGENNLGTNRGEKGLVQASTDGRLKLVRDLGRLEEHSVRGIKILCILLINHGTVEIFTSFAINAHKRVTPLIRTTNSNRNLLEHCEIFLNIYS